MKMILAAFLAFAFLSAPALAADKPATGDKAEKGDKKKDDKKADKGADKGGGGGW